MLSLEAFRKIVILLQVVFLAGGLGLSILSIYFLVSADLPVLNPVGLEIGGIILGVLSIITAVFAGLAAVFRHRAFFALYGLLLSAILIMSAVGYSRLQAMAKPAYTHRVFSDLWDAMDGNTLLQVQAYGECCGFNDYNDRLREPCQRYRQQVGCYQVMEAFFAHQLNYLLAPLIALMAISLVNAGVMLVLFILLQRKRQHDRKKLISDRQPFDAWHKAVFN